MKQTLLNLAGAIVTGLLAWSCHTAAAAEPADSFWKAKEFQVETFALPNTQNFTEFDGGYGLGGAYFWHKNFGVGARIAHIGYDVEGVLAQDFSGAFIARLPIDKLHAAPYLRIGAGYDTRRERSHIDSAVGLEWRWTRHLALFGEAQLRADFSGGNTYVFPVGLRFAW